MTIEVDDKLMIINIPFAFLRPKSEKKIIAYHASFRLLIMKMFLNEIATCTLLAETVTSSVCLPEMTLKYNYSV
jgi:hypothetical protein